MTHTGQGTQGHGLGTGSKQPARVDKIQSSSGQREGLAKERPPGSQLEGGRVGPQAPKTLEAGLGSLMGDRVIHTSYF